MDSVIFEGSLLQQYLDDEGIDHECTPSLSAGLEEDCQNIDPDELDTEQPDSGAGIGSDAAVSADAERHEANTRLQQSLARQHDEIVGLLAVSKSFLSTLAEEFSPLNFAEVQHHHRAVPVPGSAAAGVGFTNDSEKPGRLQQSTTLEAAAAAAATSSGDLPTSFVSVASELITGMVRLHRQLNRVHRKVRDAELVSRGYRLALPLPPIQRIERSQSTRVEDLQCLPLRYKMMQVCRFGQELIETSAAAVGACFSIVNESSGGDQGQQPHVSSQQSDSDNSSALEPAAPRPELAHSEQDMTAPRAPEHGVGQDHDDKELTDLSLRGLRKGNRTLTTGWKEFWAVLLLCFRRVCAPRDTRRSSSGGLAAALQRLAALHSELVGHASGLQMLVGVLADALRGHTLAEQLRHKQEEELASQAWNDNRIGWCLSRAFVDRMDGCPCCLAACVCWLRSSESRSTEGFGFCFYYLVSPTGGVLHCLSELRTEADMVSE